MDGILEQVHPGCGPFLLSRVPGRCEYQHGGAVRTVATNAQEQDQRVHLALG
jgi:hypothetical protein